MSHLAELSIIAWLTENAVRNEKGELIDFKNHRFLYDIYRDQSQYLCVMKAAQVGMSTLEVLKNFYDANRYKMDIIYTLPTDADVQQFVGGKVNRILAQNPILQAYTKDKDTIEQKQIGDSMIYFRGTWTAKQAIMVTADRLVHDEVDSSKQDVVKDYEARLQHSKFKQKHVFSHPSVPGNGVHTEWEQSDQKHWLVKCGACKQEQYLEWPQSICPERKVFVCKECDEPLSDDMRRKGRWARKVGREGAKYSGYWVSLLMCPWVTAQEILDKYNDTKVSREFFWNKVLGLPYVGSGNKVFKDQILGNLTDKINSQEGRLVIGVDPGIDIRYVIGNREGLFYYGQAKDYEGLDALMTEYEKAIMVIDQGGDIIGQRKLREKYPGRVFLCHYRPDRKTLGLIKWGDNDEDGNVIVDRNRMIQLVIDEFSDKRIPLQGNENDWYDYWLHWSHIYRDMEINPETGDLIRYVWKRSDRDDWVHATVYWRVGMDRFGAGEGALVSKLRKNLISASKGAEISVDNTMMYKFTMPSFKKAKDWRS